MCEITCPYKDKCASHPTKCGTCSRNTGKRDYYRPRRDWYTPYYPYYPYWKPQPYPYWQITCDGTGNNNYDWETTTVTWTATT